MSPVVKYIGGATLATALAFAAAALAATSLEEPAEAEQDPIAALIELDDDAVYTGEAELPAEGTAQRVIESPAPSAPVRDEPFVIRRVLPIDGPIRYGEWHWDETGVPDGPLIMTVDLSARVLSVFRGGYEIGATAVLLGTDDYPTPLGVFPILTKERHNVSEKYDNAPMPWTLRLTWDGVAIHGGSTVENGYASHGCIAAPDEFVSRLFAIARKGDRVIITDGKRTSVGQSLVSG